MTAQIGAVQRAAVKPDSTLAIRDTSQFFAILKNP
jgi:hypothetical protein